MADRTYVIVPVAEVTLPMLDAVLETDEHTLRKSVDTTLTVLKWEGANPPIFNPYTKYTHAQILVEMAKPEWTPPLPPQ